MKKFSLIVLLLSIVWNCDNRQMEVTVDRGLLVDSAMVVSARVEASRIGVDIMKRGGNAFDAMVATDLALAVAYPIAGNIGGGGFAVFRTNQGETGCLDYREKAPLKAHRDMYLDENGEVIDEKSTLGALAIGIPGTVAGLFEIHEKYGTLPFKDLIQPAIDLAKRGVVVTEKQAANLNYYRPKFLKANDRKIFLDREWKMGDTISHLKLASTLERIRDHGVKEFYEGQTADLMVAYTAELGGIISKEDLIRYKPVWREPVEFEFKGHKVISMPPPSSGGICMAQIIKSLEKYDLGSLGHNSEKYVQLLTEAERRVYADRAYYLGDPDFNDIPVELLMSASYNQKRMSDFSWNKASDSKMVSHGEIEIVESDQTTHYSIVDQFGNAVAVTTTINGAYGSKVYVEEAGFFLNNEMDDLSAKAGRPNMFGLIGAEANSIEPEKRMLSSMTPTIVEQNGKLRMVVGSPGGSKIITSVLQNVLNVIEFDMGMQESVSASRFHHQWIPDQIVFEKSFDTLLFHTLRAKGYQIKRSERNGLGKVDAILVMDDGRLEGGADPRGDDTAVGF